MNEELKQRLSRLSGGTPYRGKIPRTNENTGSPITQTTVIIILNRKLTFQLERREQNGIS